MELMIGFLTSKTFLVFVTLIVIYNVVRRRNKRIQARSHRVQDRLKDRIRDRQIDLWDSDESNRNAGPDGDGKDAPN